VLRVEVWGAVTYYDDSRAGGRSGRNAPRPIAEMLAEALRERGLDDDVRRAQVLELWPQVVGVQIATVTQARLITEDGTLVVGVKTHAWMQELTMMERSLVARLNAATGESSVTRIRWELLRSV
jgi:predicted nucleic acid-binding Zn ribbon protein